MIASIEAETLFMGGKSMGGRIASLIADEAKIAGLVSYHDDQRLLSW